MENEISLYYDVECNDLVTQEIVFDPIPAGEVTRKSLYLKNELNYDIKYEIELVGNSVEIKNNKGLLALKDTTEIILVFSPEKEIRAPLDVQLKIKVSYLVI